MSELNDHLRDAFRAAGRRLTTQRRLILDVLRESDEHLDAEALYDRTRSYDPDISLATVYRTLAVLKEMGLVEEHRLGEEHGHYEAVRDEPHYHFTCLSCGIVIEFDAPLVGQIERELSAREGVRVIDAHLHLTGYCGQCKEGLWDFAWRIFILRHIWASGRINAQMWGCHWLKFVITTRTPKEPRGQSNGENEE